MTQNYQGVLQKLLASGITITAPTADAVQMGKDGTTLAALSAAMTAGTLTNTAGTLTYTLNGTDTFTYTRNANSVIGPFTSDIRLVTTAVAEPPGADGIASAGALPTLNPVGSVVRYGRVQLKNAYGSELLALPIPMAIEYVSSSAGPVWRPNTLDTCTSILASQFAWDFLPAGVAPRLNNLAACESAVTVSGTAPNFQVSLSASGAVNSGWANLTLNLGATAVGNHCTTVNAGTGYTGAAGTVNAPWLQYPATVNPVARATFGIYKSPLIYRRENY